MLSKPSQINYYKSYSNIGFIPIYNENIRLYNIVNRSSLWLSVPVMTSAQP